MPAGTVEAVERTVQKTNQWLDDLARELGTEDRAMAWRVERAFLQLLRQRLTVSEAAQLGAQLPHLLRGVYYEGFDPDHQPDKIREREEFLARVSERTMLDDSDQAARAIVAAARVLREHISAGEWDDVLSQLPREIRELLEQG